MVITSLRAVSVLLPACARKALRAKYCKQCTCFDSILQGTKGASCRVGALRAPHLRIRTWYHLTVAGSKPHHRRMMTSSEAYHVLRSALRSKTRPTTPMPEGASEEFRGWGLTGHPSISLLTRARVLRSANLHGAIKCNWKRHVIILAQPFFLRVVWLASSRMP